MTATAEVNGEAPVTEVAGVAPVVVAVGVAVLAVVVGVTPAIGAVLACVVVVGLPCGATMVDAGVDADVAGGV